MERFKAALIFLLASALTACGGPGGHGASPGSIVPQSDTGPSSHVRPLDTLGGGPLMGSLRVLLGDSAPQLGGKTLAHLYVGIWRINVSSNGQTGTLVDFSSPQVIDVLKYQGNSGAQAANNSVPTQTYNQLTFVVDIPSSQAVFTDGTSMPLGFLTNTMTQSSANAGATTATVADGPNAVDIVSSRSFTVPAGNPQAVRVDFNAFESLAMSQAGTLMTNPTLFLAPTASSGQISGTVVNTAGSGVQNAVVVATDANGNVGNTALTDSNGNFTIGTLSAGAYRLSVYNAYTNSAGQQFSASGQTNTANRVPGPKVMVTAGNSAPITAGSASATAPAPAGVTIAD